VRRENENNSEGVVSGGGWDERRPKYWLRRAITTSLFFARSAGHTDRSVKQQTLAEALK
jgi:hypothetical protein